MAHSKEDHRCPKCGGRTRLVMRHVGGQVVADRACDECNVAIERPGAPEPAICRVCGKPIREGEAATTTSKATSMPIAERRHAANGRDSLR